MSIKKSLHKIIEEYQKIEIEILNNEGVLSKELEDSLKLNELELGDKLDGYQKFIIYLKSQVDYLKTMESHYSKKRKILENSIGRYKKEMISAMELVDKDKIKTINYNYSIGMTEKWEVDIENINKNQVDDLISKKLGENSFKPYINKIKLEYKNEDSLPDWIVVSKNKHIKSM